MNLVHAAVNVVDMTAEALYSPARWHASVAEESITATGAAPAAGLILEVCVSRDMFPWPMQRVKINACDHSVAAESFSHSTIGAIVATANCHLTVSD